MLARDESLPGNQFAVVDRPRSTSDRFILAATENPGADPRRPIGASGVGGAGVATNAATSPPGNNTASGTNTTAALPAGFTAAAGAGTDESGLPTRVRCDVLGAELVLIPATVGIFGSETGPAETRPQVRLFQDAFYITQTELTVGQYAIFQRDRDEKKIRVPAASNASDNPKHPVLGLSWGQAQVFVRWAGMELPTEVEWELAARGPSGFRCPWGDGRALWPDRRTPSTISPVGRYRGDISPYGVYDLAGNAKEWCADWYSPTSWASSRSESTNQGRNWSGPRKAEPANHRVVKGNAPDWSCWAREGREMSKGYPDVGVRGVLRLPSATPRSGT
ncbi:MAG: SUMF1/EgtB/PvdO family nonheme iron enzyme [Planctomycetaceae bacterium]|nr:SUMF1/EgtB/PvdO family nonheme iron enzyme [Planctomycetaceae bacterium]